MITNDQAQSKEKDAQETANPSSVGPTITLPKGGGAIRGIGEKFAVNPVTGTGSLTVPIFTSPGRSGFSPKLSLSYNSGSGNGIFGFGWNLSLPSITRKTDKGLPRYDDANDSDVFILSDAEDLMPTLVYEKPTQDNPNGQWQPVISQATTPDGTNYTVKRYRPRIEGLFARIERWQRLSDGDIHWRAITKDNITSIYGQSMGARISDPAIAAHVFKWLLETTYDDKGNVIFYAYLPENSTGVDATAANEANRRNGNAPFTNCYLKRILYGNQTPYVIGEDLTARKDWLFEVVLDYGEHNQQNPQPTPDPTLVWVTRADPFSTFRSTFEVRTYRLCKRVLMFHHFSPTAQGPPDFDGVVRSTDFAYDQESAQSALVGDPITTKLLSVTQTGYPANPTAASSAPKSFPPVEFTYTEAVIDSTVQIVSPESMENVPAGLSKAGCQWIDLDGEGSAGMLCEEGGGLFYKRNSSAANTVMENGIERAEAQFDAMELVTVMPGHGRGLRQFMDLASDGHQDMVMLQGPVRGFYRREDDKQWDGFRAFQSFPNLDTRDPNVKFIDVDGDGLTDILVSEDEVFSWHRSFGERGFGPREYARKPFDEEKGPALIFADPTQSIFLADMTGDGLTDIVRIRSGEVCYWPNLGYGRFGARVSMDNAPRFDTPGSFEPRRLRLADIDGSGTTDILYLRNDGIAIYFNQSGNSWADETLLDVMPAVNNVASINVMDLLGNGTACLVWSSPLPTDAQMPMQYIDLMGGQKPHLLVGVTNNLGAETRVRYASSNKFYIQDRQAGTPWVTRLGFPVYVVERMEVFDYIGRTRLVTTYRYRHGYFDGVEREFRGFGCVEQRDAESFGDSASLFTEDTDTEADALHAPPVVTKTWFHTGAWPDEETVIHYMAREYYGAPNPSDENYTQEWTTFLAGLLPDTVLPGDIFLPDGSRTPPYNFTGEEEREAVRALKGSILRQEIYADDASARANIPYSVSAHNYTVECFQPQAGNLYAVFLTHARETIDYHYERNPNDARVTHTAVLAIDPFGDVLQSISAAYARNLAMAKVALAPAPTGAAPDLTVDASQFAQPEQVQPLFTLTENTFTSAIDTDIPATAYRGPMPSEVCTYELTRPARSDETVVYAFADFVSLASAAVEISYETPPDLTKTQKRLVNDVRTLYLKDDLSGPLALGQNDTLGLVYETYKLAFTAALAQQIFVDGNSNPNKPATTAALGVIFSGDGGYVNNGGDTNWWVPSGLTMYSPVPASPPNPFVQDASYAAQHFYLTQAHLDPFGQYTRLTYDVYNLLPVQTQDALGNTISAQNDYRVLQPSVVTDPNANLTAVIFDELGMLIGTAVEGKNGTESGDSLANFTVDVDAEGFINSANPLTLAPGLLGSATSRIVYDLQRFSVSQTANPTDPTQWEPVFAATIARETHVINLPHGQPTQVQVSFSYSDGLGREIQKKVQAEPGPLDVDAVGAPTVNPRWVGSGWVILNNKAKPVRQYEPFFTATHQFEFANKVGVTPTLFYDPLQRVVATLHPNNSWEKVLFGPWLQVSWDVNDTVLLNPKTDADVGDLFSLLPDSDYLPTWYQLRTDPANSATAFPDATTLAAEQDAAAKAAAHAGTPGAALLDVLARAFLSVAHNRSTSNNVTTDQFYATRTDLDIEGNQLGVIDAIGRTVMTYDYNMQKGRIHQASMEAGQRWTLNNVLGKAIHGWDSRGFMRRMAYDALQRPIALYVTGTNPEVMAEQTLYGESQGNTLNFRGRVYQVQDAAGTVTSTGFDFKGNLLGSTRRFLTNPAQVVNWSLSPAPSLNTETFTSATTYDALNRPTTLTAPDGSVITPSYNEASLLEQLTVKLAGASSATTFVSNIDYNAKRQRVLIQYGNTASTTYTYDPETFRLTNLRTTRPQGLNGITSSLFKDEAVVQDLDYTFDPAGNITRILDNAILAVTYNNQQVQGLNDYTCDAIYRLFSASGREHIGQTAILPDPQNGNLRDYPFAGLNSPNPADLQALRNYTENYGYDAVGNILNMVHVATNGGWTRQYTYSEASLIEPAKMSNRLSITQVGNGSAEKYLYDPHGNMTQMPHLPTMDWDFKDQLSDSQQQVISGAGGDKTFYIYDAGGRRVRKFTQANSATINERFYIGGFEVYREYSSSAAVTLERQTLHIMDDKQRIALVETRTKGTDPAPQQLIRYQTSNHLGSACLELDNQAQVISYEEYYPYGTSSFQAVRNQTDTPKRYRYTNKERDEENGLYYHEARYCAPWLGRWTGADQAGMVDGTNLYAYVRNNPIRLADHTGHESTPGELNSAPPPSSPSSGQSGLPRQQYHWGGRMHDTPPGEAAQNPSKDPLVPDPPAALPQLDKEKLAEALAKSYDYFRSQRGQGQLDPTKLAEALAQKNGYSASLTSGIGRDQADDTGAPPKIPDHKMSDIDVVQGTNVGYDFGSKGGAEMTNVALTFPHLNFPRLYPGGPDDFMTIKGRWQVNFGSGLGPVVQSQQIFGARKPAATDTPVYRSQISFGAGINLVDFQAQWNRGTTEKPNYKDALIDFQLQLQGFGQVLANPLGGPLNSSTRGAGQISLGVNVDIHISPHLSIFIQGGGQYSNFGGWAAAPLFIGFGTHTEAQ
jgi:RHS repeat-associated protein